MAKVNTARQFASYIWFLDTIYNMGPISKAEIIRRFERNTYLNSDKSNTLTERTFYRWRDDVEQLFDVNIVCNHNRDNLYTITCDENIRKEGVKRWLLNSFSLKNILGESGDVADRILVEEVPSGQKYLTDLVRSIKDNSTVRLTYQGFGKDHASTFAVEPYCLKFFRQRWYLYGRSVSTEECRIYALDRIKEVTITQQHFNLPDGFDVGLFFADRIGVNQGKGERQTVRIRIDSSQTDYLLTLPLHASQQLIERDDDYSIFEYNLVPNYELTQELRKYGPELEVLAPAWLRTQFLNDAKRTVEAHKRKENQ